MLKNIYEINSFRSYKNGKIEEDYVMVEKKTPNGNNVLETMSIKIIDINDVVKKLTQFIARDSSEDK